MKSTIMKITAVVGLAAMSAVAFASDNCCGELMACCLEKLACCF